MTVKFTSVPTKTLTETISGSSMSFRLNNIESRDEGTDLTSADFGTEGYGVFRSSDNKFIEFFVFDPATIASASVTILYRGIAYSGENRTTEVSANKLTWIKGDTKVELGADNSLFMSYLKDYIDGIAIAGSPDSTTTTKGIVKMSTAPSVPTNPIAVSDTDPRVNVTNYPSAYVATSAGAADAGKGIKLDGSGLIDTSFLTLLSPTVQVFTSSDTWTKPAGVRAVIVEVIGGGGGGKGVTSTDGTGGGGSAGGYSKKRIVAASLGATETVTIGAAGAGSTGNGTNGGNSSFGAHATANGGTGNTGAGVVSGGTAASGDINITGGSGRGSSGTVRGGDGGSSMYGQGGSGANSNTDGGTAVGYGAGGGGACTVADATDRSGGSGTAGIVIVTEFYS